MDLRCYTLAPPRPTNDTNYTCTFTNKAGQQKQTSIPVTVIEAGDKYCSINGSYGVTWNVSKAGVSATASCPPGRSGYLARDCSSDGVWLTVQDNCISQVLQVALSSVQAMEQGLGIPQVQVPQIIQYISSTNGTIISNAAEVSALVTILGAISQITATVNNTFNVNVVTSFLTVASNLTDPRYSSLWKSSNGPPASKVLQSVERFSQLLQVDNGTFEIDLQNIQLKGSAYERGSVGKNYQKTFDTQLGLSVSINQQTISSLLQENDVKIITVVFSSIGSLLTDRYSHESVCWLNPGTGAIYTFAIPAGFIIVFNFFTLLVVIAKLSRPSVSDASLPDDRDTAKSILKAIVVLTPVFGFTWAFGFALLTDLDNLTKQIFTYGFAGMNAFQGFFILLTCIMERKVREVLFNKPSSSPTSTTTSTSEAPGKTTSSIKKEK
ncbi:adhesion G-protein coupled receptor F3-like [Mixophyes fleayi]|uniref:adhesion G-protein coupled receptor F3-like n=1 Tax=Mixophyes fleayi TaxID=3061075 RepID=UPI003F4DEDCF